MPCKHGAGACQIAGAPQGTADIEPRLQPAFLPDGEQPAGNARCRRSGQQCMTFGGAALADQPLRFVQHQAGFTAQAIRHHGHAGSHIGRIAFQGDASQRPKAGIGIDAGQHAPRRRDAIGPQQPVHAAGMIVRAQPIAEFRQQTGLLDVIQPGGIPGVARPGGGRA